tara:strand:- start:17327 stop:17440 length:114 start_codon:yes stop_codon:yes gene_type:complete
MINDKKELPREKVTKDFLKKITKERIDKINSGKTITK